MMDTNLNCKFVNTRINKYNITISNIIIFNIFKCDILNFADDSENEDDNNFIYNVIHKKGNK